MSAQKPMEVNLKNDNRFPSYNAGWSNINLETHHQPPGETPEFCLDHDAIAINIGCQFQAEQVLEGTLQKAPCFYGAVVLCPRHYHQLYRWNGNMRALSLNLKPELLSLNAIELLETDHIELIPQFAIQDGLIHQLGLALQAELQSQGGGSRLYAETMANALAVHLLQHYSTQRHQILDCNGGLAQHKLRLVIDYINEHLECEVGLNELAAIAQLSQHHFCRTFKQATGLSPHQYLIQQRVERVKQLLQAGKMRISEVAIACGFTHQSHLNRHFKRLTGVTPKTWRNS